MMQMMYDGIRGSPIPTATGMAPLSSMMGTMEIRNTHKYFPIKMFPPCFLYCYYLLIPANPRFKSLIVQARTTL